jgi:hypothetical protein
VTSSSPLLIHCRDRIPETCRLKRVRGFLSLRSRPRIGMSFHFFLLFRCTFLGSLFDVRWTGELNGRRGLVPAAYVKIV